jgi:hypothetical protein
MAFSNARYDTCAYKQYLAESIGTMNYTLDPCRYYHPDLRRLAFGIVGGNDVSITRDPNAMVDLESDLRGQTRLLSRCPSLKYQKPCPNGSMNTCQTKHLVIRGNPSNRGRVVDVTPVHLPEAQMFRYTPIPLPPALVIPRC